MPLPLEPARGAMAASAAADAARAAPRAGELRWPDAPRALRPGDVCNVCQERCGLGPYGCRCEREAREERLRAQAVEARAQELKENPKAAAFHEGQQEEFRKNAAAAAAENMVGGVGGRKRRGVNEGAEKPPRTKPRALPSGQRMLREIVPLTAGETTGDGGSLGAEGSSGEALGGGTAPVSGEPATSGARIWERFTPQEINPSWCLARTWNDGRGGQCSRSRVTDSELCKACSNRATLVHGLVTGEIPEGKLKEFMRASERREGRGQ